MLSQAAVATQTHQECCYRAIAICFVQQPSQLTKKHGESPPPNSIQLTRELLLCWAHALLTDSSNSNLCSCSIKYSNVQHLCMVGTTRTLSRMLNFSIRKNSQSINGTISRLLKVYNAHTNNGLHLALCLDPRRLPVTGAQNHLQLDVHLKHSIIVTPRSVCREDLRTVPSFSMSRAY